jgi:2'-5' RNA ligase
LWAGVAPTEPVRTLHHKVDQAMARVGLEPERRAFHPHITLARFNRRSGPAVQAFLERNRALASEPFRVNGFTLFESRLSRHGAQYEAVAEYRLA